MFKCFSPPEKDQLFDVKPFMMKHHLIDHPALKIENIAKAILELPDYQIMYSKGLNDLGINFDKAHIEHKNNLSLEETINNIRTSNSYIAIKNPEVHPSFHGLFNDLIEDVTSVIQAQGKGNKITEPVLWMFIASPNAMTPFHFDRYSNLLMQLRGSKQVAVFPPMVEEIISAEECESYVDRNPQRALWEDEKDKYAIKFDIQPGDMVHIPFVSGHYVKNGPEDVSITLSFFFHNDYTAKATKAMQLNHRLRRRMKMIGLKPTAVGQSPTLDTVKSWLLPLANVVGKANSKISGN